MLPVHPVTPVSRVEKTRKEQQNKSKKQQIYKSKGKGTANDISGQEDLFLEEESTFYQSV